MVDLIKRGKEDTFEPSLTLSLLLHLLLFYFLVGPSKGLIIQDSEPYSLRLNSRKNDHLTTCHPRSTIAPRGYEPRDRERFSIFGLPRLEKRRSQIRTEESESKLNSDYAQSERTNRSINRQETQFKWTTPKLEEWKSQTRV